MVLFIFDMNIRIKKLLLRFSLRLITLLRMVVALVRRITHIIFIPFQRLLKLFAPIAVVVYKMYIVFLERSKRFFHSQHKVLALITNRFTLHVFVSILALFVVGLNVVQAQNVRSDEFLQKSLIADIVRPGQDTVITADTIAPTQASYIDTSAVVRVTPGADTVGTQLADAQQATAAETGALLSNTVIGTAEQQAPQEIQTYIVQDGDTASTIAAKFGVSTSTVLWSNDLSDASLIKPGQTLYILPVSGVAYTVQSGDTLDTIAEKYSADVDEIMEFNDFVSAADLTAGEEIIVPGGEKPAPPPQTQLATVRDVFTRTTPTTPTAPAVSTGPDAPVSGGTGQWPTSTRRISQYYGAFHTGLDIDGEFGDPIWASNAGTVVSAGWNGAYGLAVKVDHGNGTVTHYAHLQSIAVGYGQQVGRGQFLGEEGSTGRSSGSHLHFECLVGGRFVNPYNCVQ